FHLLVWKRRPGFLRAPGLRDLVRLLQDQWGRDAALGKAAGNGCSGRIERAFKGTPQGGNTETNNGILESQNRRGNLLGALVGTGEGCRDRAIRRLGYFENQSNGTPTNRYRAFPYADELPTVDDFNGNGP